MFFNCSSIISLNLSNFNIENNEDEIKENCELYLNNNKIDFCYKYKFPKDGKYKIYIIIKNLYQIQIICSINVLL